MRLAMTHGSMILSSLALLAACPASIDDDASADDDSGPDDDSADPSVLLTSTLTLEPTGVVDLETGTALESAAEFYWEMHDAQWREFNLQGFTRAALVSPDADQAECAAATLTAESIDASGEELGAIAPPATLCVRTQEGHLGVVRVAQLLPRDAGQFALLLDVTLWNPAEIPPPVILEANSALDPWRFVDWQWSTEFADSCSLEWYPPDTTEPARVDGALPAQQGFDDPMWDGPGPSVSLLPGWPVEWGNAVDVTLRCTRDLTGLAASETLSLTRDEPATPAPVVTSFTGEGLLTGDPYAPYSVALSWTSTDADSCILLWYDEFGGLLNYEWTLPANNSEKYVWEESWGTQMALTVVCVDVETGRSGEESVTTAAP